MTYVRLKSWHKIAMTYRGGSVKTRCGLGPIAVEGAVIAHPGNTRPTADTLPLNERSCETCLRLSAHDAEPPAVDTDTVPG